MKRRYPFEESACPQLKCRIGDKELNGGVNCADKMKAVYDKTLSLLFRGANKAKGSNDASEPPSSTIQLESSGNVSSKSRQMLLKWTSSGQLQLNGQNNNWLEPSTSWSAASAQRPVCFSCQKVKFEHKKMCDFCENGICAACLRCCYRCQKEFCQLCAITTYNLQEEMAVCLTCLT